VALNCAGESARMQQYLVTMRMLPAANAPIDVLVLAPQQYHAALAQACHSTETLRFKLVDADAQCRASGLSTFPAGAPCDVLFLHAAATRTPAQQFAQAQHRHYFRLWQLSNGLYAAGVAVLASALLYAGAQYLTAYGLRQQVQADQAQFDALSAEYARVTATFPKTATTTENLKTTIRQYQILQAQTAFPAYLLLEISKVLAAFPQVEIDRIDWRVGKMGESRTGSAGAAPKAAAPTPPEAAAGNSAAVDLGYEMATISARVVGARRADVRAITEMSSQFIGAFRKGPHLEVTGVDMPFAVTGEDTFRGDIGSERAMAEDARFALTIGRKLGK